MNEATDWLPPLVLFRDYDGDWDRYLNALYGWFKQDFIDSKPVFQGKRLGLKRHPLTHGKEATFWHMISEGKDEASRTPDFRRCERIRWPRPVIEHNEAPKVKWWVSVKRNENRIHIWLEDEDYIVVLADRKGFLLPWTAFLITREHTRRKLRKEYEAYWKNRPQKG
ncbi:hypothetical protein [Geothermobacter hydrogeniphilus]|uniref:Phage P1-related protein n=1 Tax=Geothermobacter hydrogeniphilus TaxID=1969733 RepID=A0A1X0Y3V1_9BACT|nr:hypothetical protein [Geothermobacter hydrogeniphilus]ORJ59855.1 hypothetical protein B5V00_09280 [Geothermobacter hydrogeniphilus]